VTNRLQLVSDHIPQPNVGGELAWFRAARPLERGRIGDHCPVRIAATIAGNLSRYRRRRPVNAPGDRSCGQAGSDPA